MALVPYRRRTYASAFPAPAGVLSRNVRPRYTQMMGMARYGNQLNRGRGSRYGRRGYTDYFTNQNLRMDPVYPRPEVKAYDTVLATSANPVSIPNSGTNGGSLTILNSMPANSTLGGRVGNQVSTKSVYYQYVLNFGTGPVPNAIRHLLVWDKQPNNVAAPITDILSVNQTIGPTDFITFPMNLSNRDRFVILADERTTLSPNGDQIRIISGFRKINQRTDFAGATGVSVPSTGALGVIFASDESTVANEPTIYGTWRVRYIDC